MFLAEHRSLQIMPFLIHWRTLVRMEMFIVPSLKQNMDWGKIQEGDLSKELLFTHLSGLVTSLRQGQLYLYFAFCNL
jgi:hypothetical protein